MRERHVRVERRVKAQPVHHIVRDHEISLRALSRRDPPLREESVIGGAGEPTTPGSPRWVARVGLDLLNLLEVVHSVQPMGRRSIL